MLPGPRGLIPRIEEWHDAGNIYNNVVAIAAHDKNGKVVDSFCTGTLIDHRTILTAAHCVYDTDTNNISRNLKNTWIHFSPDATTPSLNDRRLSGFMVHPAYDNLKHADGKANHRDIALFSLDRPVTAVKPVRLLQPGEPLPKPGTVVRIAGYGRAGVGSTEEAIENARRRSAVTTIGRVRGARKTMPGLIKVEFRDPEHPKKYNTFSQTSPIPTWQGQPGPGDSGGPLFMVMDDGSLTQIGVLHGGASGYGGVDDYAPIRENLDWILRNTPLRHVTAKSGAWNWSDPRAWTDRHAAPGAPLEAPDNRPGSPSQEADGKPGRYYATYVTKASQIRLDRFVSIDRLVVDNDQASILIPEGRRLQVELDALLLTGAIIVDGALETRAFNSPIDAEPGLHQIQGRISGGGELAVNGRFVQLGGVVAPGKAMELGPLVIWGSYVQHPGGVLAVRVTDKGNADRLVVSGPADISGKLAVAVMGKTPAKGQTFTVLHASELTGNFSRIVSSLPAFTWTTHADGNRIILTATGVDYGQVLADETAVVTGKATLRHLSGRIAIAPLNRLAAQLAPQAEALADNIAASDVPFPSTPALAIASLNTMDAGTLSRTLLALPPSGFHTQTGFGIVTSRLTSAAIFERLGSLGGSVAPGFSNLNALNGAVDAQSAPFILNAASRRQPERLPGYAGSIGAVAPLAPMANPTPFGLFVSASYLTGGPGADIPYTAGGITAGLDYRVSQNLTLGAALTYVEDNRSADGMKLDSSAVAPALYGRFAMNRAFIDGYLGYAFTDGKSRRFIPFGDEVLTAEASPRSGQFMAGAVAGVKLDGTAFGMDRALPAGLSVTPFVGFDIAQMNINGYTERGAGALAIALAARQFTDARLSAGFELAFDLPLAGGVLTPSLKASVTQRVGDRIDNADAYYAIAPDLPFRLTGPANARTYGTLGAGLGFRVNDAVTAQIAYQADISGGGFHDNRLTAKAQVRF